MLKLMIMTEKKRIESKEMIVDEIEEESLSLIIKKQMSSHD